MSKNYRLVVVEGQVKVMNTKGNIVDVEVAPEVAVTIKTIETGIAVAKEVVDRNTMHGLAEIPERWKTAVGILKGVDKLYYPMCTCCGSYVSSRQVDYSIEHYNNCVVCIECQRKHKREGKVYATPEMRFKRCDANYKKACDNHKNCKHQVSGMQIALSLHVTGKAYALCPKCLINYAGVVKYPAAKKTEDVKPTF